MSLYWILHNFFKKHFFRVYDLRRTNITDITHLKDGRIHWVVNRGAGEERVGEQRAQVSPGRTPLSPAFTRRGVLTVLGVKNYYWLAVLFLSEENVPADTHTGGHDSSILATQQTIYHRFGNNCGIKTFYNTIS